MLSAMTVPLFWVDAFTDRAFAGNPAAVCLLDASADEGWMAALARELGLSETAFVISTADGFDLRWFTPTVEVDLCGHATLASAHVLWETGRLAERDLARFSTRSGPLVASRADDGIEMDFPADPLTPAELPAPAAKALGVDVVRSWQGRIGYVVEVASAEVVRSLTPDPIPLAAYPDDGFVVTAASDRDDVDFVSRYFVPSAGILEDPVTGAAHCALGPLWATRLGRDEVTGFQASARGGIVRARPRGDRVSLIGRAMTVARGELLV